MKLKAAVGNEGWDISWLRVNAGKYSLDIDEHSGISCVPGLDTSFDVEPGTITIAPLRLVLSDSDDDCRIRVEPVDEEDRQKAALRLGKFFEFPSWYDREYVGFGSIRPTVDQQRELFSAVLDSNPQGATVFLDDRLAGTTPLELNLTNEKHKVLFRAAGREDVTRYVRLERDAELVVDLPLAFTSDTVGVTFRTVVGTFLPSGEADSQLADLFADTLEIALEKDPRLLVLRDKVKWNEKAGIIVPDFADLENLGADLVVSGIFHKEGNSLVVQADLYDIQAESSKTGFAWEGRVGLSIFDAMDEITEAFAANVDRYLPQNGRELATRTEILYEGAGQDEYDLYRNSLIGKRWKDRRHSLTLFLGDYGGNIQTKATSFSSSMDMMMVNIVNLGISLDWQYDFRGYFALGTGLNIVPKFSDYLDFGGGSDSSSISTPSGPFLVSDFYIGPRLIFRNLKSDLFVGINAQLKILPYYDFEWDDGTPQYASAGPFLALEMPIDLGIRVYFTERTDRMPVFFSVRLAMMFLGYQWDTSGNSESQKTGFGGIIQIGFGVRL